MPAKSPKASGPVYQVKITLRHARPPIWRRVLVPGGLNLYTLHQVVQLAMGWTDSHLHQFIIDRRYYSIPIEESWVPIIDERRFTLEEIAPYPKRRFEYEYDFGDGWVHELVVEKIMPPGPGKKYPQCVKGKRACPPEDVGGVWGYHTFLQAIGDPDHEEHHSYLEWIGGGFDPEAFDLDAINERLRRVKAERP
ncbi:MAG: plasmid pRiA4b ORF-3 family protein [Candidatus Eisenbacteria bacterium]